MSDPTQVKVTIVQTAQQMGVDPVLALAVARAESSYNQSAVSAVGAIGIFQLMPATASDLGVNPNDWADNIRGGCLYLSRLQQWYGGRVDLILAGYNWGPGNVNRLLNGSNSTAFPDSGIIQGFPPDQLMASVPAETRNYINRVTQYMIEASNDPVILGLPGSGGGQVDIGDSDMMLMAGLVIGVLLLFAFIKR